MADIDIHASRDEAAAAHAAECTCGEVNEDLPEINVQTIPHAIRHAAIFGAIDALAPGGGLIISAGHAPLPLLAQMDMRYGKKVTTSYLEQGPEAWRILIRAVA
ncbi:DUF2249 domain-containing protein [Microbacterium kribbense]|uniref:DUF2249 domain-containing protein n=1 Tax=Microbacterium kribbense TaxID=433645 RepID=A0ABP7GL55_9MICO